MKTRYEEERLLAPLQNHEVLPGGYVLLYYDVVLMLALFWRPWGILFIGRRREEEGGRKLLTIGKLGPEA